MLSIPSGRTIYSFGLDVFYLLHSDGWDSAHQRGGRCAIGGEKVTDAYFFFP